MTKVDPATMEWARRVSAIRRALEAAWEFAKLDATLGPGEMIGYDMPDEAFEAALKREGYEIVAITDR